MENLTGLTPEHKAEVAVKMVLLDAIEKGAKSGPQLIQYMKTETFKGAVGRYLALIG